MNLERAVEAALGVPVRGKSRLGGGCVGDVFGLTLEDGEELVAKLDPSARTGLGVEAAMLEDLRAAGAPAPRVRYASPGLLLMERLPGRAGADGRAAEDLAAVLAALHGAAVGPRFGYGYDTRIGGLPQPNDWADRWVPFFAERRLIHAARAARDFGRLPPPLCGRVEGLASRLGDILEEPARPSLLHGDLWSGNVISDDVRVTGLIDPALSLGHPEVELAFTTLFGSFGESFHRTYRELTGGPDREFWRVRRDVYNVYPLLVHVRLFGGGYVDDLERTLRRFA